MVAAEAAIATGAGHSSGYCGFAYIPLAQWFAIMTGTSCDTIEE
jgi:hypothetical protein